MKIMQGPWKEIADSLPWDKNPHIIQEAILILSRLSEYPFIGFLVNCVIRERHYS